MLTFKQILLFFIFLFFTIKDGFPKSFFIRNLICYWTSTEVFICFTANGLNYKFVCKLFLNNNHVLCVAFGKWVGVEAGSPPSPPKSVEWCLTRVKGAAINAAMLILIRTVMAAKVVIRRKTQAVGAFLPSWYREIDKYCILKVRMIVLSQLQGNIITCKYWL